MTASLTAVITSWLPTYFGEFPLWIWPSLSSRMSQMVEFITVEKKTSKLYNIPLSDHLKDIIEFYREDKKPSDFIFPIIKRKNMEDQYKDVKWARKRYNMDLKEIQKLCGIEETLTSYVVRHSFATQALLKEVPIKAISEMLGHSNLSTTQVYLKSLPTELLDEYAKRVEL